MNLNVSYRANKNIAIFWNITPFLEQNLKMEASGSCEML
jgi:hypothetical protein